MSRQILFGLIAAFALTTVNGQWIESKCDYWAYNSVSTFNSTNYPKCYPGNMSCTWKISAYMGHRVQLVFDEVFQLEDSVDCQNDYLEIRDIYQSPPVIGRYCGTNLPPNYISKYGELQVTFVSNGAVPGVGFNVNTRWVLAKYGGEEESIIEEKSVKESLPSWKAAKQLAPIMCEL